MGFLKGLGKRIGIGAEKERSKNRLNAAKTERRDALAGFEGMIDSVNNRVGEANNRATLSADDLFGESMTRNSQAINSNANNSKAVLSRMIGAQGGDVTGAGAVALDAIDEGTNDALGDMLAGYDDRAVGINERALSRGDQLSNILLGAEGNLFGMADANVQNEITRELKRKQANKQLIADIIGTAASVAAKPLNPAGGA